MTENAKKQEKEFAAACMIEKFDEMLANGEISQSTHDDLVSKVKKVL